MKNFLKNNGLSIAMFGLFIVFVIGQSITGLYDFNGNQLNHGQATLSYLQYIISGGFIESVFENWESEFLQMGLYVFLTAVLYQKGSAESKSIHGKNEVDQDPRKVPKKRGTPWPVKKGGWILSLYERSLTISFLLLFTISLLLHAAGGAAHYRDEQAEHGKHVTLSMWTYMKTPRFWFESFQNWQSEFLSVGALIILSIYLRQKGSPESKPVAVPSKEELVA